MTTVLKPRRKTARSLADLIKRLGGISPERILCNPPPGMATKGDLARCLARHHVQCELVEGVLVEKAMGLREGLLAGVILGLLRDFVVPRNLGLVSGADGTLQLFARIVRIPDVAFLAWKNVPGGKVPEEAMPKIAPDLAVEVLSKGNTSGEMRRKRREYFQAGTQLVWEVSAKRREIRVYTSAEDYSTLTVADTLDGGDVLPGFSVPVVTIFAELDRQAPPTSETQG